MSVPKYFFTELARPTETDPGSISEGYYMIVDGVLMLTDAAGKPLGLDYSLELKPDDKELTIARRLLKVRAAKRGFNRPIKFPEWGMA
jgi:hypothetical protein